MIPHADEIEALWQQTLRAREEYRRHPFANNGHGIYCASRGCRSGLRVLRAQERKTR